MHPSARMPVLTLGVGGFTSESLQDVLTAHVLEDESELGGLLIQVVKSLRVAVVEGLEDRQLLLTGCRVTSHPCYVAVLGVLASASVQRATAEATNARQLVRTNETSNSVAVAKCGYRYSGGIKLRKSSLGLIE